MDGVTETACHIIARAGSAANKAVECCADLMLKSKLAAMLSMVVATMGS